MNRSDPKRGERALLMGVLFLAGTVTGAVPASAQTITEFPLPAATSGPGSIVTGPDGALWYTADKRIGRITPAGVVTEFPFPPNVAGPTDITVGPDGALWFTPPRARSPGRGSPVRRPPACGRRSSCSDADSASLGGDGGS